MRIALFLVILGAITLASLGVRAEGVRERRPNLISVELGGRAGIGSVQYERYFSNRFGVGVGGMSWGSAGGVMPVYISTIPTGNVHSLYLSAGGTIFWDSDGGGVLPALSIGYQHQSDSGFFLRLSVSTFWIWPLPGLAVGGSF